MPKEINLLPKKQGGFFEEERTILVLRIIATASVVIVASIMLGLLILGKTTSVDTVAAQQEAMRSKIQLLKPKIQKDLTLVDRVNRIQTVLKTRPSLVEKITKIQGLVPNDVKLETMTVTTKDFSVALSSVSLASLTKCLDGFTSELKKKSLISTITIDNVTVDAKTGIYKVTIKGILL